MSITLNGLSALEESRFRYEVRSRYGVLNGVTFDSEEDIHFNGDFRALEEILDDVITALYGQWPVSRKAQSISPSKAVQ
jgi:hypothetical protein